MSNSGEISQIRNQIINTSLINCAARPNVTECVGVSIGPGNLIYDPVMIDCHTHFVANLDRVAPLGVIIQIAPKNYNILLTYDLQNHADDLSNPLFRQKQERSIYVYLGINNFFNFS